MPWALYLVLCLALGLVACGPAAQPHSTPQEKGTLGPITPFAFGGLELLSPSAQVELCSALGYDGLFANNARYETLRQYREVPMVREGKFRIRGAFLWIGVDEAVDFDLLDCTLEEASLLDSALWIAFDGDKNEPNVSRATILLRAIADRCEAHRVRMVLYPHMETLVENAEDAQLMLETIGREHVKLSLILVHELKSGNGNRIGEVVARVAPKLALVALAGADQDTASVPGWGSGILPLDRGTYDLLPLLKALVDHGYTGPVMLHTYGIKEDPVDHLTRSKSTWEGLLEKL